MLMIMTPFMLNAQLSGIRLVPSAAYPDMQAVADSLNLHGVGDGGISFQVAGNSVFETAPLSITATGTATSPITIGWDGAGVKPVMAVSGTAAASEAGLMLKGTDYLTLDGISITNPDGNLDYGIWITNESATNGAQHNLVKNCHITLNKLNPMQAIGVYVAPSFSATTPEGNNHYNLFHNNVLQNMTIGYSFDGSNSTTSLMAVGNEVASVDGGQSIIEDLVMAGLLIDDQNGFRLHGTTIRNLVRTGTGTTAPAGISTISGNPSATLDNPFIFTDNKIYYLSSSFTSIFGTYFSARKATYHISGNLIYGVSATGGGGNTADGIAVIGTDIIAYIYNNMVAAIEAPASAVSGNAATRGINVRTFLEAYVYHNTVLLNYTATNLSHQSAAFIIYNNSDPVEMRNNVFVNKTSFPEGATGIGAAFYKRTPDLSNVSGASNNNLYYAGTPSANNVIFYGHNSSAPAIDQTLEAYQLRAATFDQQSYTEDVPFVSETDLHVQPLANTLVRGNAVPVNTPIVVDVDFDGTLRDGTTPDIGADELANPFPAAGQAPVPANGSTGVLIEQPSLHWSYLSDPMYLDPLAFKVYFHTSPDFTGIEPLAIVPFVAGTEDYQSPLTTLNYETSYYWKVVPTLDATNGPDAQGVETWMFTTESFVFPFPNTAFNPWPDGTTAVMVDLAYLQWDFNALTGYTVPAGFKVYLSTNELPSAEDLIGWVPYTAGVTTFQALNSLTPLNHNTTYYWKVVPTADEIYGPEAEGVVVWSFTTELVQFPSNAANPSPEMGGVIRLGNALEVVFEWDFIPDPDHVLPNAFKVFAAADTNSAYWTNPVGFVNYEAGVNHYSLELLDSPNFDYTFGVPNYWKVVPTTALPAGMDALNVQTWNFHFDEYVGMSTQQAKLFSVHPNPAADHIRISLAEGKLFNLRIITTEGKEVLRLNAMQNGQSVDLKSIEDGVYYLQIETTNANFTQKLVVRR